MVVGGWFVAEEAFMRTIALAVVAVATLSFTTLDAQAAGSWCAYYYRGATNCGFYSFAQCQATVSGIGGYCNRGPGPQAYGSDYGRRGRRGWQY
jgi:hypothetical protein